MAAREGIIAVHLVHITTDEYNGRAWDFADLYVLLSASRDGDHLEHGVWRDDRAIGLVQLRCGRQSHTDDGRTRFGQLCLQHALAAGIRDAHV